VERKEITAKVAWRPAVPACQKKKKKTYLTTPPPPLFPSSSNGNVIILLLVMLQDMHQKLHDAKDG
jgi:hypothetical protein